MASPTDLRHPTFADRLIAGFDRSLKTLIPNSNTPQVDNPGKGKPTGELSDTEKKHVAGLMRINHTGEVCAQGLYQGQALTAQLPNVREAMDAAADEEIDHLVWCEQRLAELNARPSLLNPVFYGMSFALGAIAGKLGDKYSLGFVAATEEQVCKHLTDHLGQLPASDEKSKAILTQMLEDEGKHATHALNAGGQDFPQGIKDGMSAVSKVMTKTTYRI